MSEIEYVLVNGARIERGFFEENLAEARSCLWSPTRGMESGDHGHCLICGVMLNDHDEHHISENGLLCTHCYDRFIEGTSLNEPPS